MNYLKLKINGNDYTFSFGLGFLGDLLAELDLQLDELMPLIHKNPYKFIPLMMFRSSEYWNKRNDLETTGSPCRLQSYVHPDVWERLVGRAVGRNVTRRNLLVSNNLFFLLTATCFLYDYSINTTTRTCTVTWVLLLYKIIIQKWVFEKWLLFCDCRPPRFVLPVPNDGACRFSTLLESPHPTTHSFQTPLFRPQQMHGYQTYKNVLVPVPVIAHPTFADTWK